MINLTKLDNKQIVVNLDTVKYIESIPDTLIFFLNGESVIVKENLETIVDKSVEYRSKIISKHHVEL